MSDYNPSGNAARKKVTFVGQERMTRFASDAKLQSTTYQSHYESVAPPGARSNAITPIDRNSYSRMNDSASFVTRSGNIGLKDTLRRE